MKRLNKVQVEKTADLSLEVAKTVLIAIIVGNFIPGIGERIGLVGSITGFILFIATYLFTMWLLREVKKS